MKVTIYPALAGARVRNVLPPSYHELAKDAVRPDGRYSVLLFAHTERDVVHSAPVRKALRRLGDRAAPDGVLAVGTVFTAEARALLEERGARILARRQGKWTDESARARQL